LNPITSPDFADCNYAREEIVEKGSETLVKAPDGMLGNPAMMILIDRKGSLISSSRGAGYTGQDVAISNSKGGTSFTLFLCPIYIYIYIVYWNSLPLSTDSLSLHSKNSALPHPHSAAKMSIQYFFRWFL
jgi:hypothetical protein